MKVYYNKKQTKNSYSSRKKMKGNPKHNFFLHRFYERLSLLLTKNPKMSQNQVCFF